MIQTETLWIVGVKWVEIERMYRNSHITIDVEKTNDAHLFVSTLVKLCRAVKQLFIPSKPPVDRAGSPTAMI